MFLSLSRFISLLWQSMVSNIPPALSGDVEVKFLLLVFVG